MAEVLQTSVQQYVMQGIKLFYIISLCSLPIAKISHKSLIPLKRTDTQEEKHRAVKLVCWTRRRRSFVSQRLDWRTAVTAQCVNPDWKVKDFTGTLFTQRLNEWFLWSLWVIAPARCCQTDHIYPARPPAGRVDVCELDVAALIIFQLFYLWWCFICVVWTEILH